MSVKCFTLLNSTVLTPVELEGPCCLGSSSVSSGHQQSPPENDFFFLFISVEVYQSFKKYSSQVEPSSREKEPMNLLQVRLEFSC